MTDDREPTITDDDAGAPVVSANEGIQLGTIASVDDGTVLVDADPDLAGEDDARAALGWGDLDVTHPVPQHAFEERTDDGVFVLDVTVVNE